MPLENLDEEGLPRNPDLQIAQWRFLLTVEDALINKETVWEQLMAAIKEKEMAPFYSSLCRDLQKPIDQSLLDEIQEINKTKIQQLDAAIEDAQTNFGEIETRDAFMKKAEYLCQIGDKDGAVSTFRLAYDKTVALGYRMDVIFYLLRIGLFYGDNELVKTNLEKAQSLVDEGGDWDRKNRLKVYTGLYALQIRDFKTTAVNFFDSMSTFTSTELMDYRTFVKYAIFSCMVALPRSELKKKVINGAEILEELYSYPELNQYVNSLYYCKYDKFFQSIMWVEREFTIDRYLWQHTCYYVREMRVKGYSQLLESYSSLSLHHMATCFGVSESFIDKELSRFIASGRLNCRIDKVAGVVETNRPDSKNFLYQSSIKQGDILLNRIQKLSRVINI
ncbi:PREDICTED: 26S proteasome non-ATPase regulatory subunit 6-like [Amphimedon queenslandica]|uniref:26S proteasome non-ATPase regulatory subunit 6 n=1 Tax=Amphimedon queenslandica TaxID=400682 RepID=A0A1X7VQE9_AMPQE|nr:PREDICTED: 26S proteasome non-ATPase regulatory subunit 6-like [Amphimedon queenslandica]|eukprot:XP_003382982.1 PREDICTED: 26S proteasome non-ATPase regulatory subunit 6-like [Amphimedon queenslandica]